jgi:hypothetical protein
MEGFSEHQDQLKACLDSIWAAACRLDEQDPALARVVDDIHTALTLLADRTKER